MRYSERKSTVNVNKLKQTNKDNFFESETSSSNSSLTTEGAAVASALLQAVPDGNACIIPATAMFSPSQSNAQPACAMISVQDAQNTVQAEKPIKTAKQRDYDGLIYSSDKNRNLYMNRMIAALGVGESATGHVGDLPFEEERFLLFKQTLTWETFKSICLYKVKTEKYEPEKWDVNYTLAKKFRDEVLHRLAFARAMGVPELRKFDNWIIEQQQKATNKTPESINRKGGVDVHTILIQELREIFLHHNFGWVHDHFIPSDSFRYIEYEGLPSEELCPVHYFLQRYKEQKIQKIKQERENQRQADEKKKLAAEEEKRLEPLRNRHKIADPFYKKISAYFPSIKETTKWHEYLKRFDNVAENELSAVPSCQDYSFR